MKKCAGLRHLLYGLWAGWTGVLLLARSGVVRFTVKAPPDGILGYCFLNGYPKQQDYFWFGAMVLGGFAGALLARLLLFLSKKPGKGGRSIAIAGTACASLATLFGLSKGLGNSPATWFLYAGGLIAPWFYRGWLSVHAGAGPDLPPGRKIPPIAYWAVFCLVISVAWIADAQLRCREIDGLHEGTHLLYVQSILEGQRLGIDFRTEYGPLGTLGLYGWMKVAGMSVSQERMFFLFIQALGTAIHLAVFRLAGLGWLATVVGSFIVLLESPAFGVWYGCLSMLRTALAFLAVILYWRARTGSRRWLVASGLVQSASIMYSSDFGMAAAVAISAMVFWDWIFGKNPGRLAQFGRWAGICLAGVAALSLAIYGLSAPRALAGMFFGGYGGARLMGHGSWPFPAYELFGDPKAVKQIWLIGLFSVGMIAWSFIADKSSNRRAIVAGAGVFTLLAMVPGLVRPMVQYLFAVPSCAFLAALALDGWKGKKSAYAAWIFMAILGMELIQIMQPLLMKYAPCERGLPLASKADWPGRLGGVAPVSQWPEDVVLAVRTIKSLSKKGEFVYVGAPAHMHLCFLADRAGLPPYPSGSVAVTSRERSEVMASLRKYRPPVALLTEKGIDIPYAKEHQEEVEYIKRNYRLALKTGELEIYSLKSNK